MEPRATTSARRKSRSGRTGDGGSYIKPLLVQAAWAAIRTPGRLRVRYCRLVRRFGGPKNKGARKKAIIAIAHTLLKIACAILRTGRHPRSRPAPTRQNPAGGTNRRRLLPRARKAPNYVSA